MSGTRSSTRRLQASRPGTVASNPACPTPAAAREITTKRRGELAELAFTLKATSLGFAVSKPYGDSERYDFILDGRDQDGRDQGGRDQDGRDHDPRDSSAAAEVLPFVIPTEASGRAKRTRSRSAGTCCFPETTPAFLHRVQVKCSTQLLNGLYRINSHRRIHGRAIPYRAQEIDFFAAYIIPEDTWYLIPLAATRNRTSLLFRRKQDPKPGLYDTYKEAWHLLRE